MDFSGFKMIIAGYRNAVIGRAEFCELWLSEQKRLGFAKQIKEGKNEN